MRARRPTVEILGAFETAPGTEELVVALGRHCDVRASDPSLTRPDARLALSSRAPGLDGAIASRERDAVPLAVLAGPGDDAGALSAHVDVIVRIGPPATDGSDVVTWPRDGIDAAAHPPVGALVRMRWRRRLGLADDLVMVVGFPDATPVRAGSLPAALAVCAAAAVRGPDVALALALGTPVVTDDATASRLGARDGEDVVVVAAPVNAREAARELASDERTAARIGWAGRRLVERVHDTGAVARELATRLGLVPSGHPGPHLDDRLAELGTPRAAPAVVRAYERSAPLLALAGATP